jgi:hypothetical protein
MVTNQTQGEQTMSVSVAWFLGYLNDDEYADLLPHYQRAMATVSHAATTEAALARWRADPASILPQRRFGVMDGEWIDGEASEDFNAAFVQRRSTSLESCCVLRTRRRSRGCASPKRHQAAMRSYRW